MDSGSLYLSSAEEEDVERCLSPRDCFYSHCDGESSALINEVCNLFFCFYSPPQPSQPRTWNATDYLSKQIIVKSWKLFLIFQESDGRT